MSGQGGPLTPTDTQGTFDYSKCLPETRHRHQHGLTLAPYGGYTQFKGALTLGAMLSDKESKDLVLVPGFSPLTLAGPAKQSEVLAHSMIEINLNATLMGLVTTPNSVAAVLAGPV